MNLPVKYNEIPIHQKKKIREEYTIRQNGICSYCLKPLNQEPPSKVKAKKVTPYLYPIGFFDHPIHLHHDHVTGMTKGAVHCYCNAVLWEYHGE